MKCLMRLTLSILLTIVFVQTSHAQGCRLDTLPNTAFTLPEAQTVQISTQLF